MKGRFFAGLIIAASWYGAYLILFDQPVSNQQSQPTVVTEINRPVIASEQPSPPVKRPPATTIKRQTTVVPAAPEPKKEVRRVITAAPLKKRSAPQPQAVKGPEISVDKLLGKLKQHAQNPELIKIDPRLTDNGQTMYLRKAAYVAFIKMYKAARADGVALKIVSALRTFYHQKYIWDNKWIGARLVEGRNLAQTEKSLVGRAMIILKYSSMPGTSRHHWGTDIDINSLDGDYFERGEGKKVYEWLVKNASRFGFGQTYTKKDERRPRGFREEKWHWSYMPMSRNFLYQYSKKITYDHLTGFEGSEVAPRLRVIPNYVFAINPELK